MKASILAKYAVRMLLTNGRAGGKGGGGGGGGLDH